MKLKGYFYGCVSSATYGLIPLFALPMIRKGMAYDSILFYRFTLAALLLGVFLALRRGSLAVSRREVIPLVVLGVLFALAAQFLFWSYNFLSVGIASTILFIYPVFVAVLMAVLFREKVSWVTSAAIVLAFTGVAMLYGGGGGRLDPFGVALILASALSYAVYIIVVNKSVVREMDGTKLTFYAMSFSAVFFLVKSLATGGLQPFPDSGALVDSVMLSLFPTIVSCIAMVYAVHCVGSTSTAVLGALEPVTAVGVGVLIFGEAFTADLALGMLLIVAAVTMIILSDSIRRRSGLLLRRFRERLGWQ